MPAAMNTIGRGYVEALNATRDKPENKNNSGENGKLYFEHNSCCVVNGSVAPQKWSYCAL